MVKEHFVPVTFFNFFFALIQPKKFNEKKIKKKDLIHPRSRKADQVNRAKLRKNKLEGAHEKLLLRKNATGKSRISIAGDFIVLL